MGVLPILQECPQGVLTILLVSSSDCDLDLLLNILVCLNSIDMFMCDSNAVYEAQC